MKKIFWVAFASLTLFVASCSDETVDPATDPRDKFTGSWLCKETVTGTPTQSFTITISKVGSGDSVKISNFSNYGTSAPQTYAEISGNSIVIPLQNITTTAIPVQGSGIYSSSGGEKISLNYSTDGQSASAVCTK
ncbi:MAG: hypothetical protein ACKOX3_09170 [Bacteroidota bacterium]